MPRGVKNRYQSNDSIKRYTDKMFTPTPTPPYTVLTTTAPIHRPPGLVYLLYSIRGSRCKL